MDAGTYFCSTVCRANRIYFPSIIHLSHLVYQDLRVLISVSKNCFCSLLIKTPCYYIARSGPYQLQRQLVPCATGKVVVLETSVLYELFHMGIRVIQHATFASCRIKFPFQYIHICMYMQRLTQKMFSLMMAPCLLSQPHIIQMAPNMAAITALLLDGSTFTPSLTLVPPLKQLHLSKLS